jgi:hypothetical protein
MSKINLIMFAGTAVWTLSGPAGAADLPDAFMGTSSGIIALNSLPNPPATLATAHVADDKGTVVGAVAKVVMDPSGKPETVDVTLLGSNAVVAVDASQFNYDQGHNILTAQLDAQQIAQEPRAPQG